MNTKYEMAEYLELPLSFFEEIIEDFKRQYGVGCRVGKYYLLLEPKFGVLQDIDGLFIN